MRYFNAEDFLIAQLEQVKGWLADNETDPTKVIDAWYVSATPNRMNLDKELYANNLKRLIKEPFLLDQASFGLCAQVAFLIPVITDYPLKFVRYALQLFEQGSGLLGEWMISPGEDFKNLDIEKIRRALDTKYPDVAYYPVDMIVLGAIQDSTNNFLDFGFEDKGFFSSLAVGTFQSRTLISWYTKTDLYSRCEYVDLDDMDPMGQLKALFKENRHLILDHFSTGDTLQIVKFDPTDKGGHFCVLDSGKKMEIVNATHFTISIFTWGGRYTNTIETNEYRKAVWGYVTVNR